MTDKGRTLAPAVIALMQWGDRWVSGGRAPVVVTDLRGREADQIELQAGGRTLGFADLRFEPGAAAEPNTRTFLEWMATRTHET